MFVFGFWPGCGGGASRPELFSDVLIPRTPDIGGSPRAFPLLACGMSVVMKDLPSFGPICCKCWKLIGFEISDFLDELELCWLVLFCDTVEFE